MKTKSESFNLASEIKWEQTAPGIKRQIMGYDGQIMLAKAFFEKGSVGAPHRHYHSQASYIVSGVFEVLIGKEKKILKGGDGYSVKPDELHGNVCLEEGTVIDVFSPMRADFLEN